MNLMNPSSQEARFLILNKKSAWDAGLALGVQISEHGLQLVKTVEYVADTTIERDELGAGLAIADFAVGQCNVLYVLDAVSGSIGIYDPNQARFEHIECIEALFSQPTSLAFTPGTLYVADTDAEQRIFALADINWQIRWVIGAGHDATGTPLNLAQPFAPIDLAVDTSGNVYALDIANLAIVKFDTAGRVVTMFGQAVLQGGQPVSIALAQDQFLYVLDTADKKVVQFSLEGALLNEAFLSFPFAPEASDLIIDIEPSRFGVDTQGNVYIGERRTIVFDEEDDRFIHKFDPTGHYLGEVSGYRGAVEQLVVDREDRIYVFNAEEDIIHILRPEQTFLQSGTLPPPVGHYFSTVFDSTEPGMQWHKLVLETHIPANTHVQVSYLIADEKTFAIDGTQKDLDVFLKSDETSSPDKVTQLNQLDWSSPLVDPQDALIRGPAGRYVWLRVKLVGSTQHTPEVHTIRADFPRRSYLRYLPAVYQEDRRSRDFLERFLSVFETFFGNHEGQINQITHYFDAGAISGDFLRWLASWLAIAADEHWTHDQLRVLVERAPELYTKRGTRQGIEEIIEIFTAQKPFIVEQFQLQCAKEAEIQQLLTQLYGDDPYCFCVLLKPFQVKNDEERKVIKRLVDAEKPAHTCAGVRVLQPWVHLDMHTYLGVNTYLSEPALRLDGQSAISRDTVLSDSDEAGQIERRARLGTDTVLT